MPFDFLARKVPSDVMPGVGNLLQLIAGVTGFSAVMI